jgi:hypothetical protein
MYTSSINYFIYLFNLSFPPFISACSFHTLGPIAMVEVYPVVSHTNTHTHTYNRLITPPSLWWVFVTRPSHFLELHVIGLLILEKEYWGERFLRNVRSHTYYIVVYPRRAKHSSCSVCSASSEVSAGQVSFYMHSLSKIIWGCDFMGADCVSSQERGQL